MRKAIKKFAADLRIRIGYLVAFFLLLVSYLLTLYANHGFLNESKMVNHTHRVMINTEHLLSSLKDAESAFRGYIVVKDSVFLKPYYQSRALTDSFFHTLKKETSDNSSQQQRLNTINQLIQKKYQIFDAALIHYSTHNFEINDSIKIQAYFGHTVMMRVNAVGKEIENEEERLLQLRKEQMNKQYNVMNNIVMASLLLAFFLVVYGFFTYTKENNARRKADAQVNEYQQQLQQRITELDGANKELVQMRGMEKFAATGRIARTIAHEVRNPLTNINLATDQLKMDVDSSEDSLNMLEMIHRNSNRINQLITDLLNSTKTTELNAEKILINELLDETLELAKDRIELSNAQVIKTYTRDTRKIFVDKEKMKIAFLNIIVNAIEAMEPGKGILILKTESEKDKCIVKIADNGKGIDKESLSKLFEPYFTNKLKGTGLGLTNTQNIIFTHNGQISAESKLGAGTTFIVTLNFV
ncbi:MAG TPA: CHASE3 domain-containing protein [Puia sp.]|jgi:signal transduction histidine kinase|nr:CHASE3 domain-containing protein [Puia sp.]